MNTPINNLRNPSSATVEMNVKPMEDPATNAFAQEASPAAAPDLGAEEAKPPAAAKKEKPLINKVVKRRTWKKPKDKPKRPLSAYNLFFQHTRTRIVEGHTEARPEEIIRSIEWILTKSSEKRRHRKTHGRISFGDLARTIADKWKTVDPQRKAIFDQYAEVDMRRYRTELKLWKEKKEREAEAASKGGSGSLNRTSFNSVNNSFSSVDPNDTDSPIEVPSQQRDRASWQTRNQSSIHESLNSSYVSVDSCESELSLEPMPINAMQMQMQIQMQMQMQLQIQQMQMQKQQRCQQQQQQQNYPHVYQQQQANSSQANFIANANQGSMTSFPARGGGYGNTPLNMMAPGKYGNASLNSLAPNDSLLGVSSSQISDYPSSHTSGYTSGNFSSSYALGNWGH